MVVLQFSDGRRAISHVRSALLFAPVVLLMGVPVALAEMHPLPGQEGGRRPTPLELREIDRNRSIVKCTLEDHIPPNDKVAACSKVIAMSAEHKTGWTPWEPHRNRGQALVALGRFKEATSDFDIALSLMPKDKEHSLARSILLANKGWAHLQLRDYKQALHDYDEAVANYPANDTALTGRCAARAEMNSELDRALSDCERAIEIRTAITGGIRPAPPFVYNMRALVFYRLNRLNAAIKDCNTNLEWHRKASEAVWALYMRGLARLKAGDPGGATDIATAEKNWPGIAKWFSDRGIS